MLIEADADGRATAIEQLLSLPARPRRRRPRASRERPSADASSAALSAITRQATFQTPADASGSRATHVEVVRGELDLGQDGGERHGRRERVHPPGERERAEREHPDQELRREHLAEEGEGGTRGEAREHELPRRGRPERRRLARAAATIAHRRDEPASGGRPSDATASAADAGGRPTDGSTRSPRRPAPTASSPSSTRAGELSICTGRSRW